MQKLPLLHQLLVLLVTLGSGGVFVVFFLGRSLEATLSVYVGTGCLALALVAYAWLLFCWKREEKEDPDA